MLEVERVFHHMLGVRQGIYTPVKLWCLAVHPLDVHYALSCTFFVVHYASCIYHSYDYYSSGYDGVFWSVIYFISAHGPFLDGAPATSGQYEVVLLPPLMLRCPGGVIGLASVPQQQPPIFDASSDLCQLCYGFSTGRFLF